MSKLQIRCWIVALRILGDLFLTLVPDADEVPYGAQCLIRELESEADKQ